MVLVLIQSFVFCERTQFQLMPNYFYNYIKYLENKIWKLTYFVSKKIGGSARMNLTTKSVFNEGTESWNSVKYQCFPLHFGQTIHVIGFKYYGHLIFEFYLIWRNFVLA